MKSIRSLLLATCVASVALVGSAFAQTDLEKAAAALKAGDLAAAEALVAPRAAATPADAAALHLLSQIRVGQRRAKEAVEAAEAALKADATQPAYHSQLGVALSQRMGEVGFMQMAVLSGKMRKAFEKSVELDPKHVDGLVGLARFYSNAPEIAGGSLTKAAEYAERVKAILPFLGETELGRIAEKREDFAGALAHYEAALAARPESVGLQFNVGRMLARLDRKDEARARFEAVLQAAPAHEGAKQALAALAAPAGAN